MTAFLRNARTCILLAIVVLLIVALGVPSNATAQSTGTPSLNDLELEDDDTTNKQTTPTPAITPAATSKLKVIGKKEFVENYAQSQKVKRRWNVVLLSNYQEKNPPKGSWLNHGKYEEFYPEGKLFLQGGYRQGATHGLWKYLFPNGTVAKQGQYESGRLAGKWTYYRQDGTLKKEENYTNGEADGNWVFYKEDGKTVVEQRAFQAGKKHGLWSKWHLNGNKAIEAQYKDGKLDGLQKYWYENGQKATDRNFKEGKRHGLFVNWDQNGVEQGRFEFENGQRK